MKSVLLSILVLGFLLGCSEEKPPSSGFPPSSPEVQAQERFSKTGVIEIYKAEGFSLSCAKACLNVTDDDIKLLMSGVSFFESAKRKISRIEISNEPGVRFTDQVGDYILFLPTPIQKSQLEEIDKTFALIQAFEEKTHKEIFVAGSTDVYQSALETLIQRSANLPPEIQRFHLVGWNTSVSRLLRRAEVCAACLNKDFELEISHVKLFVRAYKMFPRVELAIANDSVKGYDYLEYLTGHADEINAIIGNKKTWFHFSDDDDEYYMSAEGWLLGLAINVSTHWPIEKLLPILKYESYVSQLRGKLRVRIDYYQYLSSTIKYPECHRKLPELESLLGQTKMASLIIDYNSGKPSRWEKEVLYLNCDKDSVEEMKSVIQHRP